MYRPMHSKYLFFLLAILFFTGQAFGQAITPVASFGTNPGALNMYTYVPPGISGPAPLVVAMHGCTENASTYAVQTGWNKLANLHKFYVVYPEQVAANNSSTCFNWFDTTDITRGLGEALSVKQMVDYMSAHYSIDPTRIFVTGLSAGAGMTVVMMATYPDVFSKGAVMAGLPYKASVSSLTAFTAMNGGVTKTPAQWGALVRGQNPGFTNPFPKMAIFHGTADLTVNNANATELIKQWTNLNHADQVVDSTNPAFQGNTNIVQTIYNDSSNNAVVIYYKITGMAHGIAVDTGACPRQGGATGTYAIKETNFHSTYWAADFFNILLGPYPVAGAIQVVPSASNITYSVPLHSGSVYAWSVPFGAVILSGQGTNSISVKFGTTSGFVQVTESPATGCKNDPAKLYVTVSLASQVIDAKIATGKVYYSQADNSLYVSDIDLSELKSFVVYSALGQEIKSSYAVQANRITISDPLAPGIYIVRMNVGGRPFVLKILSFGK